MADQNITALPATTTPESSDQLLLVGAAEEKLIDYDKLADAILGKIASKNFTLDQGNKTLLQALNELNSKALAEYAIDVTISGTKLTAKFSDLGELDICNLFIFIVVGNDCYLSVQINHSTIYASHIVSVQGANVSMDTYTWDATNRVFTARMTSNYDGVRKSKCYAIK